ncbi:MAG: hypothetical protein ACK5GX_10855 [Bacteroidota bacterium]|jgi:hypothetical protein
MKKNIIPICMLILILATACNTTRVVKPIEQGSLQVGANLGGPLITMGSLPLFMPLSSVHAAYGLKEKTTVFASLHTTALLFGVFQTDIGITQQLLKQKGMIPGVSVSPIANMMIDHWKGIFSFYPQLDVNAYWNYKGKPHFFYTGLNNWIELRSKKAHEQPQNLTFMPAWHFGHQWSGTKYNVQLEMKYIGFTQSNKDIVVDYISPSDKGALGLFLSINRKF